MEDWNKLGAESTPAYAAFCLYRDMGVSRSLAAVGQQLGKSTALMERWSRRHGWVLRAAAYDAHMAGIDQAAREQAATVAGIDWAARQEQQREREWAIAETLMQRAADMLRFPLQRVTRQEDDEGKHITIIEPSRWTFADTPRLAESAAKLARLAAEMATDRSLVEFGPVDWGQVPDDVRDAFADGRIKLSDVYDYLRRNRTT